MVTSNDWKVLKDSDPDALSSGTSGVITEKNIVFNCNGAIMKVSIQYV